MTFWGPVATRSASSSALDHLHGATLNPALARVPIWTLGQKLVGTWAALRLVESVRSGLLQINLDLPIACNMGQVIGSGPHRRRRADIGPRDVVVRCNRLLGNIRGGLGTSVAQLPACSFSGVPRPVG